MLRDLLAPLAPPLCWSCAGPAARGSPLCGTCRRLLRFLPGRAGPVWAAVAYEGPARDLVKALKFRGATRIADEMAALLAANAPPALLTGALVPVPLHPARLRARGFNQAALIATALARRTGLPVVDCLRRSGSPAPQVGRGRRARLHGPAGEIQLSGPPRELVRDQVLLVDDVVTTGATLRACAAALPAAKRVDAIAFARTAGR